MSDKSLPFQVGAVATAWTSADLGKKYVVGDKLYRLVKSGGAVTTGMGGRAYYVANTSGVPSYVAKAATAATVYRELGVLSTEFNTKTIASSDFFLLQIAGPCKFKVTATTVVTKAWLKIGTAQKFSQCLETTYQLWPGLLTPSNTDGTYSTIGLICGFVEDADVNSTTDSVAGYLYRPLMPGGSL